MSLQRLVLHCLAGVLLAALPLAAETDHATASRSAAETAGAAAHVAKGSISGHVTDSAGAVLQGARIEIQNQAAASNALGEFAINNLAAGKYTVTISYVGFEPAVKEVTIVSGQVVRADAALNVAGKNEQILVTAERLHGEAEAINRSNVADNIVQVLPSEVITSLPNANIADAVGRLPSVTLERDEGEGKYVQIRGTEPRLSNLTIDGVNVPSPQSGVRQVKLDTIASDLVESVEINKTLQANMDADGIGGSVNLVTKIAGEVPNLTLDGLAGYTPIIGGRLADQFGTTYGRRFGVNKKLGILFGGTYDYNGRGINDVEPVPDPSFISPRYDSMDIRDYLYDRTRYGLTGSTDYKLNDNSSIFIRGLYSDFMDYGQKSVYTLQDTTIPSQIAAGNSTPSASVDWRRPDFAIGSITAGGHHVFSSSWLSWNVSVARSRELGTSDGGADFSWNGGTYNCTSIPSNDMYRPAWSPSCFTPGPTNTVDLSNYALSSWHGPSSGIAAQLNLEGDAAYAKNYHMGSHFGTFEFGGKVRNAHKYDDSYSTTYTYNGAAPIGMGQFATRFSDPNYYDGTYPTGMIASYSAIRQFVAANPGLFTMSGGPGPNKNDYSYIERVSAGYLMNTLDLTSRLRLVAGVRFEGTQLNALSYSDATQALTYNAGGDYLNVLPSAALRIRVTDDSGVRLVYAKALSRPDPQDIAQAEGEMTQNGPGGVNSISVGNPNLKAETANNYDLLYERTLKPLGMIQAGVFYKELSNPIVTTQVLQPFTYLGTLYQNVYVSQPGNAGSAHLVGFEASYQQHLGFLPGMLSGFGIMANYSYTASEASGIPGRTDHPALLRQAPNTWNISPTYDRGRFSVRVGMAYNGANIYAYQYQNLNPDGTPMTAAQLAQSAAGGVKGPGGDNYLYSHFQLDAQGSIRVFKNLQAIVQGLNLNNEVFGFYNGSPQYVVQREYYKPTIAGGIRWTPSLER
jgi:TonB-dependent receptor